MNTELTCFKDFTPKSFNDLVQMQVQGGYPIGEKGIEVESPFYSVLNQGAHGTCTLVLAVSYMKTESNEYGAHMFQGFDSRIIQSRCMCRKAIQSQMKKREGTNKFVPPDSN